MRSLKRTGISCEESTSLGIRFRMECVDATLEARRRDFVKGRWALPLGVRIYKLVECLDR